MNISFFLQPKCNVAYIYSSDTFRQGLEKMDHYGYTAIPVLDDKERYVGTITEGDFLWSICSLKHGDISSIPARELEKYMWRILISAEIIPVYGLTPIWKKW